jgi:hypothetical protein
MTDALAYNALVRSWPEITRLAREGGTPRAAQTSLLEDEDQRDAPRYFLRYR